MEKLYLDNSAEILELAALAEAGVRNFYRACSARWDKSGGFWQGLAAEEDGHYKMVTRMLELVNERPERYALRRRFASGAYRSFIDWVVTSTAGVANGALANKEAMDIANTIETTILESQVQELIQTTVPEFVALIGQLTEQTRRHSIMVKAKAEGLIKEGAAR